MIGNDCPECSARLQGDMCKRCGWAPSAEAPAKVLPPAYREFEGRQYVRAAPTDRCTEEGCTLTVDEHRAEFRRHMATIAGRFSERSEATDDRTRTPTR